MTTELQRELGRIEMSQEAMSDRMDRFEKIVTDGFEKLENKLDKYADRITVLEASENKRAGAWSASEKVLASIGAIVVLFGQFIVSWVASHLGAK